MTMHLVACGGMARGLERGLRQVGRDKLPAIVEQDFDDGKPDA